MNDRNTNPERSFPFPNLLCRTLLLGHINIAYGFLSPVERGLRLVICCIEMGSLIPAEATQQGSLDKMVTKTPPLASRLGAPVVRLLDPVRVVNTHGTDGHPNVTLIDAWKYNFRRTEWALRDGLLAVQSTPRQKPSNSRGGTGSCS